MINKNEIKIKNDSDNDSIPNEDDKTTGVWKVIKLIEKENLEFFLDENNIIQVLLDPGTGKVVELNSDAFRNWVLYICYEHDRKPPGTETISRAVTIYEFKIKKNKLSSKKLFIRVAEEQPGVFWYDLGCEAIRYDAKGWIKKLPPIIFKRFNSQKAQVVPMPGKGLDQFVKLMNLNSVEDGILLKTFIISSFIPNFSHPILVIHGQQGSAKSTLSRYLKDIIDPAVLSTRALASKQQDFTIAMSRNWAMFYDNITNLTAEQSDSMCRSSTGEGVGQRKLYTDQEEVIFNFKNILGLNGVNCVANKPDLLSRTLIIKLSRIPDHLRKTEKEINKFFENLKPYILGECFDIVTKTIAIEPGIKLKNYPRMADFSHWGYMINEVSQIGGNVFLKAYENNILIQNENAVEVNPVAVAVMNLIKSDVVGEITGTPEYIYKTLISHARQYDLDYTHDKYWPKNSSWLIRKLEEIIPNLDKLGIIVSNYKEKGKRWTTIKDKSKMIIESNAFTSGSLLVKDGWQPDEIQDDDSGSYNDGFDQARAFERGEISREELDVSQIPF